MKNNKKGFTLIELIVCIGILVTVSVAGTFGLLGVLRKNRIQSYKNDLSEVMRAAYTYTGIEGINDAGDVTIETLLEKGLLDSSITQKINALTCNNFDKTDKVYYLKSNSELKFYMLKGGSTKLYMGDINKDETIVTDC